MEVPTPEEVRLRAEAELLKHVGELTDFVLKKLAESFEFGRESVTVDVTNIPARIRNLGRDKLRAAGWRVEEHDRPGSAPKNLWSVEPYYTSTSTARRDNSP